MRNFLIIAAVFLFASCQKNHLKGTWVQFGDPAMLTAEKDGTFFFLAKYCDEFYKGTYARVNDSTYTLTTPEGRDYTLVIGNFKSKAVLKTIEIKGVYSGVFLHSPSTTSNP